MSAPNMATIAASLERSLQNCSLSHSSSLISRGSAGIREGFGSSSSSSDSPENHSDAALELNSQISLPYHWEQCLDLKTGEIYYINWRTGMKAKEDPRTTTDDNGDYYSEDESSYDSEGSSSESSPSFSSRDQDYHHQYQRDGGVKRDHVLVVAGCKSCLMYFMVPKQGGVCPKCAGQLLHFDRSVSP